MRSVALGVLALLLMSSLAAASSGEGTSSRGDRSPGIYIVDDNGGFAFTTIHEAVDAASPGDIVRVHAGTYNETVVVDKNITLSGNGTSKTIIDGQLGGTVVTVTANDVTIDGFTIRSGGMTSSGIDIRGVDNTSISNCSISGNRIGVRGDQEAERPFIRSCQITDNSKAGIWLVGYNGNVADCVVSRSEIGISVTGRSFHVWNNSVHSNDVGIVVGSFPDRVLMMGNSYTNANSLDRILEGLMGNIIPNADAQRLTSGGLRLSDHASRAQTPGHTWNTTLNGGTNWDTLVLQDQSQIPGFPTTNQYWKASMAGARVLDGMIEEAGADTMLMMTWGRRDGDASNPTLYPNFTA
ncbi:MAG: right-handed parallel beta-helix repeat-containing protein, partial [Thermoplasmata archaeon]|nr:right-handed parallel beta-helix repeat-containing protein [Thermoplasmata archaeon]